METTSLNPPSRRLSPWEQRSEPRLSPPVRLCVALGMLVSSGGTQSEAVRMLRDSLSMKKARCLLLSCCSFHNKRKSCLEYRPQLRPRPGHEPEAVSQAPLTETTDTSPHVTHSHRSLKRHMNWFFISGFYWLLCVFHHFLPLYLMSS